VYAAPLPQEAPAEAPAATGEDVPNGSAGRSDEQQDQVASAAESDRKLADESDYELMKLFVDTLDEVERNYVRPISRRELMEAAIQGVLGKLDEYSNYIAPSDIDRFRREVENEFGGIGIRVMMENDQLTVIAPIEGTPAYEAKLVSGDVIVAIDGAPAAGLLIEDVVRKLRGRIGTEVTLRIQSDGSAEPREVTLKRAEIHVETVLGYTRGKDQRWSFWCDQQQRIGYARITSFNSYTAGDLERQIRQLQSEGMRGLVLDLRFNPGGLLESAIAVSDLFLKEGRIVSTKGRNVKERVWDAKDEGTLEHFPMVVLVNHFSASASEIVSACLQDHDRATIVGDRTWGKGSVQRLIDLEQGRSALKLTTASYFRPSGKNIHRAPDATDADEWGVQPSDGMKVELNQGEMRQLMMFQQDQMLGEAPEAAGEENSERPVFVDRQLQKGLEVIKEKL
jgi:carboxyl-terminal processing protease